MLGNENTFYENPSPVSSESLAVCTGLMTEAVLLTV